MVADAATPRPWKILAIPGLARRNEMMEEIVN